MSEDPNRELRAMVLVSLPYPPLPVLAARVECDDNRLQEDASTCLTSHTLIARGLDEAMARNRPEENDERKQRQLDVFRRFLHAMATDGFHMRDPEPLYQLYCRFTLEHVAAYLPPGHPVDIRFQPLASITRGDPFHAKMAEYMASQSLLQEDPVPVTRAQYLQQDYAQMLFAARDRLGHVMTPEERARLPEE